jgi:REP element-mobilizing transposase RayT
VEPHDHRGWHIPRRLPHFDGAETVQSITFRLADSLPHAVALARKDEDDLAYRRRIAVALDAGQGECLLRDPSCAEIVEDAFLHGAPTQYELFAWVIMPNHVHVLVQQAEGRRLSDIVQAWKSWTAREINRSRRRTGGVWQRQYHDRYIRDHRHFDNAVAYIEWNPVQAGLVATPEGWRFGSAWWRANRLLSRLS